MKKSFKEIEGRNWEGDVPGKDDSYVFRKAYELYHKEISTFSTDDLRFIIGQNHYLEYVMPLAIKALENNPFEEANSYPGSLLENVLKSSKSYWSLNPMRKQKIIELYNQNETLLEQLEVADEIKWDLQEAYKEFIK